MRTYASRWWQAVMSNLVQDYDPELEEYLYKRIWENNMPGYTAERPSEPPEDYQALAIVAQEVFGTIVPTELESVLLYQGMDRRYQVRWNGESYVVESGRTFNIAESPGEAIMLLGGPPPFHYVERNGPNGKQYVRIFLN